MTSEEPTSQKPLSQDPTPDCLPAALLTGESSLSFPLPSWAPREPDCRRAGDTGRKALCDQGLKVVGGGTR